MVTALVAIGVVRRSEGSRDSYGNATVTTTLAVVRGVWAPGPSGEITTQQQDQVITQPTVYLPDVELTAADAVIPDIVVDDNDQPVLADGKPQGTTYEVDGEPMRYPANPFTGWRPVLSLVVPLRKVTG